METEVLLKQIAEDVADIKKKIVRIENGMEELDIEMHDVKPEYIERLKEIEKGKHYKFSSMDELKKLVEDV